jgi:hypothetical protein
MITPREDTLPIGLMPPTFDADYVEGAREVFWIKLAPSTTCASCFWTTTPGDEPPAFAWVGLQVHMNNLV